MGFKILDANKEAITIKNLDKEICELWGIEMDPKWYASPVTVTDPDDMDKISKQMSWNWFDQLGHIIHQGATTWDEVREKFWAPQQGIVDKLQPKYPNTNMKELIENAEEVKKTLGLIEYWRGKGYTPLPVKDY